MSRRAKWSRSARGVSGFKVGDHVALDPFGPVRAVQPLPLPGASIFATRRARLGGAFAEFCIAPVAEFVDGAEVDGHGERRRLLEPFATGLHAVENPASRPATARGRRAGADRAQHRAFGQRARRHLDRYHGLAADAERLALAREMGFKTVCASDRDWTRPGARADAGRRRRRGLRRGGFARLGAPSGAQAAANWSNSDGPRAIFRAPRCARCSSTASESFLRACASRRPGGARSRLVASGAVDLKPMVTHRYDLDHGIEAFELLHAKQGVKALIMPQAYRSSHRPRLQVRVARA